MSFSVISLGLPPVQTSANTSFESCSVRFRDVYGAQSLRNPSSSGSYFIAPTAAFAPSSVDNPSITICIFQNLTRTIRLVSGL